MKSNIFEKFCVKLWALVMNFSVIFLLILWWRFKNFHVNTKNEATLTLSSFSPLLMLQTSVGSKCSSSIGKQVSSLWRSDKARTARGFQGHDIYITDQKELSLQEASRRALAHGPIRQNHSRGSMIWREAMKQPCQVPPTSAGAQH